MSYIVKLKLTDSKLLCVGHLFPDGIPKYFQQQRSYKIMTSGLCSIKILTEMKHIKCAQNKVNWQTFFFFENLKYETNVGVNERHKYLNCNKNSSYHHE